jgi:hypothetical protein
LGGNIGRFGIESKDFAGFRYVGDVGVSDLSQKGELV